MPRDPTPVAVAIWTIAPLPAYTPTELQYAWHVHDQLHRGTLILNAPHRP